jgi:hypothetical protein
MSYPCCKHCAEDSIHDVEVDGHELDCTLCHDEPLIERGREEVRQAVLALWNRNDGWIPGADYRQLAETLNMDPELFLETRKHRPPPVDAPGSY